MGTRSTVAAASTKTVAHPAATSQSRISVTLVSEPGESKDGTPAMVHWVARGDGQFTVHLTGPVGATTAFTFFIVEGW